MPIDDPNIWLQGDAFRSAVRLVCDAGKAFGGDQTQKVIDQALDHAVGTAAIAEAEIAKALG